MNNMTSDIKRFRTLRELIDRRALVERERPYLIGPDDQIALSYSELRGVVRRYALELQSRWGVSDGDRVGIFLPNGADFVVAYLAIMYLGAVACPINNLLQDPEIDCILESAKATTCCVAVHWSERIERLVKRKSFACAIVPVEGIFDRQLGGRSRDEQYEELRLAEIRCDKLALIVHTSGSTGRPKGVPLSHSNLLLDCEYICDAIRLTKNDRALCILPLFHTNAEVLSVLCPLYSGGSVVIPRQFHASQFWPLAIHYEVTWCSAAPTIFFILIKRHEGEESGFHLGHQIRFFVSGTSALPVPLMRTFEQTFGVMILEGYGLTETVCRVAFNRRPPDEVAHPGKEDGCRRFGSVGTAIGDTEIEIVDENDRPVRVGERGEVVLRGSVVMKGYFENDAATDEAFRHGWFHTGDIGYMDEDGYLYIVDRKKDMIIRGGQNIYPREVDIVLGSHPKIEEAAVIGVPNGKYGEEVKAYVVSKKGMSVSAEEIIEFCRERLAAYKCPKSVRFIEAMPKGPTGKLLRVQLARFEKNEASQNSQEEK
jgi:acyl-CoA synthetase (AMP-forming)/AMP-acid ligase II